MAENIISINRLIGMKVLSRTSGNELGSIRDVSFSPVEGVMLGIIIQNADGRLGAAEYRDIYSFGQDAVMAQSDEAVKEIGEDQLNAQPLIKRNLNGTEIITEGGNKLGQIANVLINLTPPPFLIYEVRESLMDKLLGRGIFVLAQTGRAFSNDSQRIVVADETENLSAYSIEEVIRHKENLLKEQEQENFFPDDAIVVRTFGEEETLVRDREEETLVPPSKTDSGTSTN